MLDTAAIQCASFVAALPPAHRYILVGCPSAAVAWDGQQIVIAVGDASEQQAIAQLFAAEPADLPYSCSIAIAA